ncbi:MAG: hypothetical protein A2Y15_07360 [Clostridiales bacterium GWF2_36_10]|nr:MAG: hypothetical protein A2Y15_07360 [Clostridiales bacterium GWF2_36_10]HAN21297.1 hypothetical protein [Clostridiales bacterium]
MEKFTFTYKVSGQLYSSTDLVNSRVYTYEYDSLGRLMDVENSFDSLGRASGSVYLLPGKTMNYGITYKEGRFTGIFPA